MEIDISGIKNRLLCIEYPGIVNNDENMLQTLGGLTEISRMIASRNRRLELRFRPNDPFCKPACGDRCKTNSLLLKVKVRVKKGADLTDPDSAKNEVIAADIVARITSTIKFKSLCDFQYLPMSVKEDGSIKNLVPSFLPQNLSADHLLKWFNEPSEFFLPPPAFARVDNTGMNSYMYRKGGPTEMFMPVIGRTRKKRSIYGYFVSNDVKNVPMKPREKALNMIKVKMCEENFEKVKKMFEERPVWSKLALACVSQLPQDVLKIVLPAVAYYFVTGPFRIMWARFGYDPRQVPEAKIYQTLDYRMRFFDGLKEKVKVKRGHTNYVMPIKTSAPDKKAMIISKKDLESSAAPAVTFKGDEYLFCPNKIPSSRQMFYQYCDLKIPEVVEMFERLPKTNESYDPKTGWLPRGFDVHCRELISKYLTEALKKDTNINELRDWKPHEGIDDLSDEDERWQREDVSDGEIDDSDVE